MRVGSGKGGGRTREVLERPANRLALERELLVVRHVLKLAAAADRERRSARACTGRPSATRVCATRPRGAKRRERGEDGPRAEVLAPDALALLEPLGARLEHLDERARRVQARVAVDPDADALAGEDERGREGPGAGRGRARVEGEDVACRRRHTGLGRRSAGVRKEQQTKGRTLGSDAAGRDDLDDGVAGEARRRLPVERVRVGGLDGFRSEEDLVRPVARRASARWSAARKGRNGATGRRVRQGEDELGRRRRTLISLRTTSSTGLRLTLPRLAGLTLALRGPGGGAFLMGCRASATAAAAAAGAGATAAATGEEGSGASSSLAFLAVGGEGGVWDLRAAEEEADEAMVRVRSGRAARRSGLAGWTRASSSGEGMCRAEGGRGGGQSAAAPLTQGGRNSSEAGDPQTGVLWATKSCRSPGPGGASEQQQPPACPSPLPSLPSLSFPPLPSPPCPSRPASPTRTAPRWARPRPPTSTRPQPSVPSSGLAPPPSTLTSFVPPSDPPSDPPLLPATPPPDGHRRRAPVLPDRRRGYHLGRVRVVRAVSPPFRRCASQPQRSPAREPAS